jgi:hypothetical protein
VICYAAHSQLEPVTVADGAGGFIVVWRDTRDGPGSDLYAQRLDAEGAALWPAGEIAVCAASGDQEGHAAVADGAGGVYVAWSDHRGGSDWDVYAQHLDAGGQALWDGNGIPLAAAAFDQNWPVMIADGEGGVIIAWNDLRNHDLGTGLDIYAQRLAADGTALWPAGGVAVVGAESGQRNPALLADGSGGLLLAWEDYRNDDFGNDMTWDVYAGRVTAAGALAWEVPLIRAIYTQDQVAVVADGAGGMLVFWQDGRDLGNPDIYGSRVTGDGTVLFPDDTGVQLTSGTVNESLAAAVGGTTGRALVFWYDDPAGPHDLVGQAYDADLAAVWPAGGLTVCDATDRQTALAVCGDGAGGALLVWQDRRAGQDDIYAQRLTGGGDALWPPGGLAVCRATGRQTTPDLCGDGAGGALLAWHDERLATVGDIYGHHATGAGDLVPVWITDPPPPAEPGESPDRGGGPPLAATLRPPTPNPANPRTRLTFTLPVAGPARLRVHDARGRRVITLLAGDREAGRHHVDWDGRDRWGRPVASGTYLVRLSTLTTVACRKLQLVR